MKWTNYLILCVVLATITFACSMYVPAFGLAVEHLLQRFV